VEQSRFLQAMLNLPDYAQSEIPADAADSSPSLFERIALRLERLTLLRAALLVFLAGLCSSVAISFVVRPMMQIERPFGGEPYDGYIELAQNLVAGNGYVFEPGGSKVFHRPPLYPVMLIPGVLLPQSFWKTYVALLNSGLVGIASAVVLWWGRKLFGARIGGTGWKTSLYPKDGRYLVPVKAWVRKTEGLEVGDMVTVRLAVEV